MCAIRAVFLTLPLLIGVVLSSSDAASADPVCPLGYVYHAGHIGTGGEQISMRFLKDCVQACEWKADCKAVEFSPSQSLCIKHMAESQPTQDKYKDFAFCEKQSVALTKLMFQPSEYSEQDHAQIPVGGQIRIFAVGSSSLLWMTWLEQLHWSFLRLGYSVPVVPPKMIDARFSPSSVQHCDDSRYFLHLKTPRFGKIGWNSWDFAFEDWSDCDATHFRNISGHRVRCEHGPGCRFGTEVFKLSDIAEDASASNITLVTTWFNDPKQMWTKYECWDGEKISLTDTTEITIPLLLKTIRAIHAKNPDVWVLIMSKYPPAHGSHIERGALSWFKEINARVRDAVEKEPRTHFVDFQLPGGDVEIFQSTHWGHPNCRGDKLMANAVLDTLFKEKILARSVTFEHVDDAAGVDCGKLGFPGCHSSALCWVDPADRKCKAYSPGTQEVYTIGPPLRLATPTNHDLSELQV